MLQIILSSAEYRRAFYTQLEAKALALESAVFDALDSQVGAHSGRDTGQRRILYVLAGVTVLAAVALLALVAGGVSDALAGSFWADHPLLAGLVASLIVVMLTVALVNEAVERRSRQRWSELAHRQHVRFTVDLSFDERDRPSWRFREHFRSGRFVIRRERTRDRSARDVARTDA